VKKFSLLLLDANVVIRIFELGIWDRMIKACDAHLARTVVGEADFYEDRKGVGHRIDLDPYKEDGRITVHDVLVSQVSALTDRFGAHFLDRLHDGETESLALLVTNLDSAQRFTICSSDAIVFRVLGALKAGEQGLSLEEVLQQVGLNQKLERQFCKAFRVNCTRQGFDEGVRGFGVKQ